MKNRRASVQSSDSMDIFSVETQLLNLMGVRSRLFAKIAIADTVGSPDKTDRDLEQKLWALWKKAFQDSGHDPATLKKSFLLLNSMAYSHVSQRNRNRPFCLFPRNRALCAEIQGPTSTIQSQVLCFISAFLPEPFSFSCTVSSFLFEEIKALNKCGAGLSWIDASVQSRPMVREMTLDANIVYVGKSALNLYLLLCLGLKSPTLLKLTCDSELKIQDFKFLQEILPLLGARLAPLEPHGNLLPAKLEASGILPSRVELPVNTPVEFATALIACGPLYEKDLSILLPPSLANHRDIIRIVDVVARFRPETTIDGDTIYLRAAGFSMPSSPVIPDMDPALAGLMLALPYVAGGNIRLQGHWPSDHPLDGPTRELLLDFGLAPIFLPDAVYSSCETRLYPSRLDITNLTEELLPLATALAFASGKNTTIVCNTSRDDIGHSRDFLHHVGAEYQISTQGIHVSGIRPGKAEVWASPSPAWTLALSLVSFQQPGVCLSNPGIISEVWPSFWNIFTSLPEGPPPHAPTQIREEANEPEPVAGSGKRRIRI